MNIVLSRNALEPAPKPRPVPRGLFGRGAGVVDAVVLLIVSVILIAHGARDLGRGSALDAALAWLGLGAVPVLVLVARRLAVQVARAKADAADNARRLAGAAETGRELVWEMGPDGTITYMTAVAEDLFGVDPTHLTGHSILRLLPAHEHARAQATIEQCVRERRGWHELVFETTHADGAPRCIETSGMVHLDHAGRVQGFTATSRLLDGAARQRIAQAELRARIQDVLDRRAVRTVFQPIVDIVTGRTIGYEALTRFDAEPAQSPDRWFADADQVELGVELDCLAMQAALTAARELPPDCYLSVNATPPTLASGRVTGLITGAPIASERIVIEITEHVSVGDYHSLRGPLAALRSLGVRIAVDDTGSGYASLRHILQLRPDIIKIDQDIIRDIHRDPARRALAAALVTFARDLQAAVTAEGIENADDLATITTLGINAAQGYHLGRPATDPELVMHKPSPPAGNIAVLPRSRGRDPQELRPAADQ